MFNVYNFYWIIQFFDENLFLFPGVLVEDSKTLWITSTKKKIIHFLRKTWAWLDVEIEVIKTEAGLWFRYIYSVSFSQWT